MKNKKQTRYLVMIGNHVLYSAADPCVAASVSKRNRTRRESRRGDNRVEAPLRRRSKGGEAMTRKKHPALSMTLRQCYDRYYDRTELAPRSISQAGHNLKRWETLTGDPPISKIDETLLEDFRQTALKKWSPASINATRTQLLAILRRLGPQFTGNPTGSASSSAFRI